MSTEMTREEYLREVANIAESMVGEAADDGDDRDELYDRLHETIDGHQWVIYTAYNFDVLRHSDNDGAYVENFGADGLVTDGCLNTAALAYAALEADVSESLGGLIEDCEECDGSGCEECGDRGWVPVERVAS